MRFALAVLALSLAGLSHAADPIDPVVCDPDAAPIVVEQRTDGLLVAHLEFSAPLGSVGCTAWPVVGMTWTVERCDQAEGCVPYTFKHTSFACGLPRFPARCTDTSRVVVRPRGAALYRITVEVAKFDGSVLADQVDVRVGRRPARAR